MQHNSQLKDDSILLAGTLIHSGIIVQLIKVDKAKIIFSPLDIFINDGKLNTALACPLDWAGSQENQDSREFLKKDSTSHSIPTSCLCAVSK